jgi:hypothetical protein
MYKVNLKKIAELEIEYKDSILVMNLLSHLVDNLNNLYDLADITKNSLHIQLLLDLKILENK